MSVYIPVELQRRVRAHFEECCAYCQTAEKLTATVFEFEHISPRAARGETIFENICLACPMCNRYKSDSASATDPVTNAVVRLFHPHQDRWLDHFSWNDDGTELLGRTAIGRATIAALRINRAAMIRVRRMWVEMGEHPPNV
jgi:hypothetical protein